MFGEYFILLPIGAGFLFLAALGYASIEDAILDYRQRRGEGREAAPQPRAQNHASSGSAVGGGSLAYA